MLFIRNQVARIRISIICDLPNRGPPAFASQKFPGVAGGIIAQIFFWICHAP